MTLAYCAMNFDRKDVVKEHLGNLLDKYGNTVMLAYGTGSIKLNGIYEILMQCR